MRGRLTRFDMSIARFHILALMTISSVFACSTETEEAEEDEDPTFAVEHFTAKRFLIHRELGDRPYVLVGTGARRAGDMINIYGAAMYVGEKAAATAWRSYAESFAEFRCAEGAEKCEVYDFEKLRRSSAARRFLVNGDFPKTIEMAFVRDVTASGMSRDFDDAWDRVRLERETVGPAFSRFMDAISQPVASGERITVRTSPDNEIWVTTPHAVTHIQGHRRLIRALWSIRFGNPCLQPTLRDGMMSSLSNVHALLTR